jgi:hypothetical protein
MEQTRRGSKEAILRQSQRTQRKMGRRQQGQSKTNKETKEENQGRI